MSTPAPTAAPAGPPIGRLIAVLAAAAGLVGLDSLVVSPLIPEITAHTHTALGLGGFMVTVYAAVYAVFGPLFGPVSDRWGRKKTLLTGLVVFLVGTALTGTGSSFALLLGFRAVAGLGAAILMPSVFALVSDSVPPQRRGSAIGLVVGTLMGTSVIGVPLGAFAANGLSWRVPFFAIAALALIEIVVVRLAIPSAPPTRQIPVGPFTAFRGQFKAAFAEPTVAFVLISSLLWWAGNQGLFANTGVFYGGIYHLSTAEIGWIVLVTGAAGFGGNMLGGRLADRFGKRPVIATAAGGAAVTMVVFSSLTGTLAAAVVVQVVWSLFFGLGQASLTTLVSELSPKARGTALSLNGSAQYSGMMLGTAIAALILDHGGRFIWIGSVSALFCALIFPIVLWLVRERRESPASAAPSPAAQPEPSAH